jgi:hypothetical protein
MTSQPLPSPSATPPERLLAEVAKAYKAGKTSDQRKTHLQKAVEHDAVLLWQMFHRYFDTVAGALLNQEALRHAKPQPKTITVKPYKRAPGQPRQVANGWTHRWLTEKYNGRTILQLDIIEAHEWRKSNHAKSRVLELALQGLPRVAKPIGAFRSEEEIMAFGEQAEAERAAA